FSACAVKGPAGRERNLLILHARRRLFVCACQLQPVGNSPGMKEAFVPSLLAAPILDAGRQISRAEHLAFIKDWSFNLVAHRSSFLLFFARFTAFVVAAFTFRRRIG